MSGKWVRDNGCLSNPDLVERGNVKTEEIVGLMEALGKVVVPLGSILLLTICSNCRSQRVFPIGLVRDAANPYDGRTKLKAGEIEMMTTGFMLRCAVTLSAVLASSITHADNLAQSQFWMGGVPVRDVQGAAGGVSSSAAFDHIGPEGVSGSGYAGYEAGVLTTSAHVTNPTSSVVQTLSTAGFGDRITISSDALNGQAGSVKLSLYFPSKWEIQPDPSNPSGTINAFVEVVFSLGAKKANFGQGWSADFPINQPVQQFSNPTGYEDFDFVFGQEIDLQINLTSRASTKQGVTALLDNSVYWGGISVVTVDGQAITDFSVTSASGIDWAKSYVPYIPPAVPEPSGVMLVLAGAGVLAAARKRAQRERQNALMSF